MRMGWCTVHGSRARARQCDDDDDGAYDGSTMGYVYGCYAGMGVWVGDGWCDDDDVRWCTMGYGLTGAYVDATVPGMGAGRWVPRHGLCGCRDMSMYVVSYAMLCQRQARFVR